jgi:hypothetical protein
VWQNRSMSRASLLLASAALALTAAGCGGAGHGAVSSAGAGGSSRGVYLAAVAKAADVTGQVPGYKFELTSSTSFGGQSFSVHGTGSIDDRGRQGSISLQVEGKTLSEIISRPYVYVELPSGSGGSVSGGKPWLRTDISTFTQSFGGSSLGSSSADPAQTLSFLKAVGTVEKLGGEDVRGVPATRYHATVELARYPASVKPSERTAASRYAQTVERITGSDTLPIDVWIDGQSHVRRVALSLRLCSPQGKIDEAIDMKLYDYGPQPAVEPPPASQVSDIGDRLGAEAEKNLQKLHC